MRFATLSAVSSGIEAGADAAEAACLGQLEPAETQGYESAWIGDTSGSRAGLSSAHHLVAAALCARTTRIRIGVTCALDAAQHPLRLAEEVAMLDVMSGGRLAWAVGPPDDADLRSPSGGQPDSAGSTGLRVFREQLTVALRALAGERFSFEGEFFQIPELQCFPPPVQSPHPRLFIRADSAAGRALAAECGFPAMIGPFTPTSELVRLPAHAATSESVEPGGERLCVRAVHVGETDAGARSEAEAALATLSERDVAAGTPRESGESLLQQCAIVGDASRCRDQLAELAERAESLELVAWHGFGSLPRELAVASQRRLIEDVAPGLT